MSSSSSSTANKAIRSKTGARKMRVLADREVVASIGVSSYCVMKTISIVEREVTHSGRSTRASVRGYRLTGWVKSGVSHGWHYITVLVIIHKWELPVFP